MYGIVVGRLYLLLAFISPCNEVSTFTISLMKCRGCNVVHNKIIKFFRDNKFTEYFQKGAQGLGSSVFPIKLKSGTVGQSLDLNTNGNFIHMYYMYASAYLIWCDCKV